MYKPGKQATVATPPIGHRLNEVPFGQEIATTNFADSPISEYLERHPSSYNINPIYGINLSDILRHMRLAGSGAKSTFSVFPGSEHVAMSRGRETGDANQPVFIPEKAPVAEYYTLGILSVKALGLRDLSRAHVDSDLSAHKGDTGIASVSEIMIDANIGDLLVSAGAVVGNAVAVIRLPVEVFLAHYQDPQLGGEEGLHYANSLIAQWGDNPPINIPAMIRITDPLRLHHATFSTPYLLYQSSRWIQAELAHNGLEKFSTRYNIPDKYLTFLLDGSMDNADITNETTAESANTKTVAFAKSGARLLSYVICRNYVICLREHIDASFDPKDIGNCGRLHDFAISLDSNIANLGGGGNTQHATQTFKSLVEEVILSESSVLKKHELISILEEIAQIEDHTFDPETIVN